jgi:hypothetical protein
VLPEQTLEKLFAELCKRFFNGNFPSGHNAKKILVLMKKQQKELSKSYHNSKLPLHHKGKTQTVTSRHSLNILVHQVQK